MPKTSLLPLTMLMVALGGSLSAQTVEVKFSISLTEPVAESDALYLAGNTGALGKWNPRGVALTRVSDRLFEAVISCLDGEPIEFKVTKGSWATVEKTRSGGEVANRTAVAKPGLVVEATVESWAQQVPAAVKSTVVGTLEIHRLTSIEPERMLRVWLPPGYHQSTDRYPVLYMLDGQNLFDRATSAIGQEWGIDETLTGLIESRRIRPLIVVAIDNSAKRVDEYTPLAASASGRAQGGSAAPFARWIVQKLKPQIDREYRTEAARESTWIGGSSLGGLFSLYTIVEHNDTFAGAIAMSPSLFWANEGMRDWLESSQNKLAKPTRLWIDFGDQEGASEDRSREHVAGFERVRALLDSWSKPSDTNAILRLGGRVFPGAEHNESAWRERFGDAILFIANKT